MATFLRLVRSLFASVCLPTRLSVGSIASLLLVLGMGFGTHADAQTAHFSGAQIALGGGFIEPWGVAVDTSGNVYVADRNNNAVKEIPVGCLTSSCVVSLGGGFSNPQGIAVDASGNVFVADTNASLVKEIPAGCKDSDCVVKLGGSYSFKEPYGLAVDRTGNVFVADTDQNLVEEILKAGGYTTVTPLGGGFSVPTGVAVDGSGNIFVTDHNGWLEEMHGGCLTSLCVTTLNSSFGGDGGVAVDGSSNVFVADMNDHLVKELLALGAYATVTTLSGTYSKPTGVAVDSSGNVYLGDFGNNAVYEIKTSNVNIGSMNVGSTSSAVQLTFTFNTAGTILAPSVLTQGAPNLDFKDTGNGTCTTNGTSHTYNAGDTCIVDATFTPKYAGARYGAVELLNSSGGVLATAYIYGTGVAPQIAFLPGTQSAINVASAPYSITSTYGVTVDASSNAYISDYSNNAVYKLTPSGGSYTQTTIDSNLNQPNGVAVDGAGNVFVANYGGNKVIKETLSGGSYTPSTIASNYDSDIVRPVAVAVDGSGNVYALDGYSGVVVKLTPSAGVYTATTIISNLYHPAEIAVDSNGNLYITDTDHNKVLKETLSAGTYIKSTIASNINNPHGIAVEGGGNVFISSYDSGSHLWMETPSGGSYTQSELPVSNLGFGYALALDGYGNLFIADGFNDKILKIDYSGVDITNAMDLSFASTTVGSTNGPQSVTVANIGNAPLSFTSTGLASPADFQVTAGSGSPVDCANSGTVAAGSSCNLSIEFTPSQVGSPLNETITLTDNNLNVASALQSIGVHGTSTAAPLPDTTATAVSISPGSLISGQTASITATVTDTFNTGATPTGGTVAFTDAVNGGSAVALSGSPVTLSSGQANLSVALSGAGTHVITATYVDVNGSYASSSGSGSGTVTATPSSNVGTATTAYPVTVTLTTGGTVSRINVLTQGATGLDFADARNGDTCLGYQDGQNPCTVYVTFTPAYAGLRNGAVVLEDASGNVLGTALISDIGMGPQIAFGAGTATATAIAPTANSTALNGPTGIAMDGAGNLFIADIKNNRVVEKPAGDGAATAIATTVNGLALNHPAGMAVDGEGNLYIADAYNWRVVEVPAGGGAATAIAPTVNGLSLNNPVDVALDGAGDLFISDTWNNRVVEVSASGMWTAIAPTVNGLPLSYPSGIAVDGAGNLFIVDTLNQRVVEVPAGGGTATAIVPTVNDLALNYPSGIVVDGAGNLFIADTLNNRVVEVPGDGNAATAFAPTVNGVTLVHPNGIMLNGAGDLFVSDHGNSRVVEFQRSLAPVLNYSSTAVGVKSSDSPQTVTVENTGNAPMVFTGLGVATDFPLDSSAASVCTSSTSLATGSRCTLPIDFTPATIGAKSESVTLTDNSLNGSVSQNIQLSGGAATQGTPTVTWPTASAITYGQTLTSSTLSGGSASVDGGFAFTTPGIAPGVGTALQSVTFTPMDAINYNSVTSTVSLTVNTGTATVTLGSLAQNYSGSPLSATATTNPAGLTVNFTYNGSSTLPTAVGSYAVVGTISDANYTGTNSGTLIISYPAVNLSFNVTGLAFGSQPLGSSSSAQTLLISNPSGFPVTLTGIVTSGDFSATSNCPIIAALGTCSVNVVFTPTTTGARTGTLAVANAQSNSLQTLPLTGTGTAPGIQVTPALLSFGSQVVTTTSSAQTITILNTGTASLNLSNVVTTGDFATTSNCATVPAGSYCSLTVTFTPLATEARAGSVTFTDNAGNGDQSQIVSLSGIGTVAGATLTPSALTFPGTVVGATSFVLTSTLTNTGTGQLTGISVSAMGDFTQTTACPGTLAPGATCIISVQSAPTVAGTESGTLNVTDSLGTQSASLLGTGLAPGASLSTAQLVFGGQLVDTSSRAQTVIFTNTGSAPVNITSVVPTSNFTDTTNCFGSISVGASCSINIVFTPTTAGSQSGTVTVTDSVGRQVFAAQGQGVSPGLAVTPSFEIFGAQVVGTVSQAQTLTARNTGSVPLTLNPITTSSDFSEADQCPAVLQPGASCAISLSFSPAATGVISGSLVVSDASGLVSTLVTSSGQGTLPGISATPSTLSFGSLPVETTSEAQTVTVSNTGTAPLQIGAVSGTGDFAETDTCASKTIAVGSYCVINITMTPSTVGTRTGAIQINDNADGAHLIALSGMGQETGVAIYPTSLAFGSQPFVSAAQASLTAGTALSVAITNTGNLPLQLSGLSTQGDFTETNSCGTTVAVGGSCTLTVNFVPTALGHRTGALTITDNAGGGTQMVSLQGDGSPVGLTLLPPMLSYGVQTVGITSQPQATTLTNNTGQPIASLQIVASGEYSETNTCGNALANAASCTLNVTITPATTGSITGTITVFGTLGAGGNTEVTAAFSKTHKEVTDNSGNSSLGVVAVTASAIPPGISLSIPVLSFSVTSVGMPSSGQTLTLQNTGTTLSLTHLQISETNVPEFPFTTNCPATLPAQATCTITINFTPASYGLRAGTMNITADGGIAAALPESGTAIASVSQLAFGAPPAAAIALGGNAGSPITVLERNSNGNTAATSTDTITLAVAGPVGYSRIYTAAAVAGVATFNLSSNALTTAGGYTYTAGVPSNASIKPAVAGETVSQAASAVSVTAGNNPSLLQNSVTFTATVTSTAGTPTGTVNFLDGTTQLGSGLLSGGVATFATSSLPAGSHSITAVYIGDANFVAAPSGTLTQAVIDFAISAASAGSGTSQTVLPGGSATYSLGILPTVGTVLPAPVTLAVSGMPEGATAIVTPSSWTQLNGTSWSFPANTPLSAIAMTVQLPQAKASLDVKGLPGRKLPLALWGGLLLPFAGKMRRTGKRFNRMMSVLLLLIAGISAMSSLSGCGTASGFFGQQQKTYTVTVTATAGSLSHSTTVTLTVE